jgi:4-nitrophenyl phosphatase
MSLKLASIKHLLIDLDGVLYRGNRVLDGAAELLSWLRAQGVTFRLVTNNATLTPKQYVEKLAKLGIGVGEDEVFTSALATAAYLKTESAESQTAYVIGEQGLLSALDEAGIRVASEAPDWVIVGLDREVTYEKLSTAALAIESGARFVATNPDASLPTEQGLLPGAGAIQAALTATTGVVPLVIGKPQPLLLRLAMKQLGGGTKDTAMLGDRLDTDIQGANGIQMPSILVLTGISKRSDVGQIPGEPDLIVEDLPELMRIWPAKDH